MPLTVVPRSDGCRRRPDERSAGQFNRPRRPTRLTVGMSGSSPLSPLSASTMPPLLILSVALIQARRREAGCRLARSSP